MTDDLKFWGEIAILVVFGIMPIFGILYRHFKRRKQPTVYKKGLYKVK